MNSSGGRRYQSSLRREQQQATRDRILGALADLLTEHAPNSYAAIAERAGVAERTVYRHFPTRTDLFRALFTWVTQVVGGPHEVHSVDDLEAMVRYIFPRYERRPEVIRALQASEGSEEMRRERAGDRRASVAGALASSTARSSKKERRKVEAAVHVLASSTSYLHLRDFWDMSATEAADVVSWAIRALARAAEEGDDGRRAAVGSTRAGRLGH